MLTFNDGVRERWLLSEHPDIIWGTRLCKRGNFTFGEIPEIYPELSEQYKERFFKIYFGHVKKCGIIEQRIAVHRLILRLQQEGWKELNYPPNVLKADIKRVLNEDLNKYRAGERYHYYDPCYYARPGRVIWESMPLFPDVKENREGALTLKELWAHPKYLTYVIDHILQHKRSISIRGILKQATEMYATAFNPVGAHWTPPGLYRRLIHDLQIKEQLNDLHPSLGGKATAALTMGIPYGFQNDGRFEHCRQRFEEIMNRKVQEFNPSGLVWCDWNFLEPKKIEMVEEVIKKYERLLIYVPKVWDQQIQAVRRPDRILEASVWNISEPDHLYLYNVGPK